MGSIKSFLYHYRDSPAPGGEVVAALKQMGRLLLDGMAIHMVCGRESDGRALRQVLNGLVQQLDAPPSALIT
jgi:hypothetical protein